MKAVLFDFDRTLATYQSHFGLYVRAAAEHGVEVTEAALSSTLDEGWRRWSTPLGVDHSAHSGSEQAFLAIRAELHAVRLAAAGAAGDLEAIAARICELECDPAHFALYEDTIPALDRLKTAGLRLGIVSNHIWRLPEIVEALGLGPYIDLVLTSARVGYRKPHPAIYRAAIEATGCPAEEIAFVGDNYAADVEGPRTVGMSAVLIDRPGTSRRSEAIRTLLDLPARLGIRA